MKPVSVLLAALLSITLAAGMTLPPAAAAAGFSDVDRTTAVGAAIYEMVESGCIAGWNGSEFRPDAPIAAADYIRMICLQKGVAAAPTDFQGEDAGYMQAGLDAGWFDWDQIPPNNPASFLSPVSRELGANIVVAAYFGRDVSYNYNVESAKLSDFAQLSGRYYFGVLGGLSRGVFGHVAGTLFRPLENLSRGDACLWVVNAARSADADPAPSPTPGASAPAPPRPSSAASADQPAAPGGATENGWLQVRGTQLLNESGKPVVLHGMSSHGIQWFPQYTNRQSVENTAQYGASVFRVAMYVEEGGYLQNPALMTERVDRAVEHAIECGMYVIIDWHILQDGNPLTHADAAAQFFARMSQRYADIPNVIYEICNEPNGNITWSRDVKPYAERLVGVIRANSPRGLILIGSPTWDQDVDQAAEDPVAGSNLMYTLHFYAGTHHQALRDKADRALALGAPIFVSEWGTSAADGSGGVFIESSDEWIAWMQEHDISWCNWSLCDKNETSAALLPGTSPDIRWTQANLSESGRYVFARFSDGTRPAPDAGRYVTVAEAVRQFGAPAGSSVRIFRQGTVLAENDIVCTGCELVCTGTEEVRRTVVVMGDVLGTGRITIAQLVAVARALTHQVQLAGPYLAAAEFGGGTGLQISDLVREAQLLTGSEPLEVKFIG